MATGDRTATVQGVATPLGQLGDGELMQCVARGDPRAFETIYERHCTIAFSLARRICGDQATAEEVTQDAFLSIWRGGDRYDVARGSVRAWLLAVVHHRAIDAVRRSGVHDRRRADEQAAEHMEAPECTEAEVARRAEARSVRTLLDELPAEQRRVIDLAYFGGFTQEQIAELVEVPLGTVKGRMRLALEKMRASIEPAEVTP